MADRQWGGYGVQVHEEGTEEYGGYGVQVNEDQAAAPAGVTLKRALDNIESGSVTGLHQIDSGV